MGQADDTDRRWHGRPLQVLGSAVARPTTAVAHGGRGMPEAPRGESSSMNTGGTAATAEAGGGGRHGHGHGTDAAGRDQGGHGRGLWQNRLI